MPKDRAVSSVLGVVLILAVMMGAITAMMIVGTVALNQAQSDTQLSQMETSMAEMSSKASLSALGDAGVQRFDLGDLGGNSLHIDPDAGQVSVTMENESGSKTEILESTNFGSLVYSNGDREVAYQGGGVWKRTAGGGGEMISPPEYHYLGETLTFPVITIEGEGESRTRGSGIIQQQSFESKFPGPSGSNPIDNASVFVEIQSDYHYGWYEFFDSRTDGNISYYPDNKTVIADLTAMYESGYTGAVAVGSEMDQTGYGIEDYQEGTNYPSASADVDSYIADCEDSSVDTGTFSGESTYTAEDQDGTIFCAEQVEEISGTIDFDTTEGDISVVFPAGVDFDDAEVNIVDGENDVSFYINEHATFGDDSLNYEGSSSQFFMYIHSDADDIIMDSGTDFKMNGIIYAPNTLIDLSNQIEFKGAIIADTVRTQGASPTGGGGSFSLEYDENLSEVELNVQTSTDELRYLHITRNLIAISLN